MEVRAEPIVPDGGTAQQDYDERAWFETPGFRLTLSMEWEFERTDIKPDFQDTLRDLVAEYMEPGGPLDFYVKYVGPTDQYDYTAYDGEYYCPKMVLNLQEEDAGLVFSEQAREKERSVMLKSKSASLTWNQVEFVYD